jgi:hypothetical protein
VLDRRFLPIHCRCRGFLLHRIKHTDTFTLGSILLDEGSSVRRDLTKFTRDKLPCFSYISNRKSHPPSDSRPMPYRLKMVYKNAFVAYFKEISRHLPTSLTRLCLPQKLHIKPDLPNCSQECGQTQSQRKMGTNTCT